MGKYYVKFSCGHSDTVELLGKSKERQRKIKYFEEHGVCKECYTKQKEIEKTIGRREVKMSYKIYKEKYADCPIKSGSYDGFEKTIVVYVSDNKLKKGEENEERT